MNRIGKTLASHDNTILDITPFFASICRGVRSPDSIFDANEANRPHVARWPLPRSRCPWRSRGALYEMIGRWRDTQRFPQRGHLVQAGSIRMNIDCSGQGSPTVILESGSGGPSVDWLMVQPEVAKFARVCSYDRAGYGWSDSGPEPRSSLQIAHELKQLLAGVRRKRSVRSCRHSMGGYDIRVYTGQYPNDVAGMVLVDASHEDQDLRAPESIRKWSQDTANTPTGKS